MAEIALHAGLALLTDGWCADVRLVVTNGLITRIECGVPALADDTRHGTVLPGLANLHSHAFQRVMAGRTERRGPGADSFWSWRELMYRTALSLSPDDVEAIAAQAYVEMLEAGFTRVGEFHYLHHDRDGRPYANIAEMAERIAAAAEATGIGLTLLPVLYAQGGFGGVPPIEGQRRFVCSLDQYARLHEASRAAIAGVPETVLGVAPHSLRAVTSEQLQAVTRIAAEGPVHIHVAEQTKEVDDCVAWSGRRPVQWLMDAAKIDQRWCLIHATHMTEAETLALATSGAVAGLCPVTEANLGDGIFPAAAYLDAGGRFGVGSDQNVEIGVAAELRMLEYGQRLANRARNVLAAANGSTGGTLYRLAVAGGAQALGAGRSGFIEGARADIVTLKPRQPEWPDAVRDEALDGWIFSGLATVDCVYVAGRRVVENGAHPSRPKIARAYGLVMRRLAGAA